MPTYTDAFKARMIKRMSGRSPVSATALSKETGVAQVTLSRWLRAAVAPTLVDMAQSRKRAGPRSAQEKLRIVLAAQECSEEDLGALLRREGIHEAELAEWRRSMLEALGGGEKSTRAERRRVRELERELRRKDKALAETAALLMLAKKARG